jgi:hypothetical protein
MHRSFVLIVLAAALFPSRGDACSCLAPRLGRTVVPGDGAVGFPTDGIVRVFLRAFPERAREAVADEYRLRDGSGTIVPFDVQVLGTRVDLDPRARLKPETNYTLEQVFAYEASGRGVSDTERLKAPRRSLRGAWFPVATFRTGPDAAAPPAAHAPTLERSELHFSYSDADCGPATTLGVELAMPATTSPTEILELRVRGQGVVATTPASGTRHIYAGDTICDWDPVTLRSGDTLDFQVALLDATGAELGVTAWTTASGSGQRPRSGRQVDPTTWPSVAMVEVPVAQPDGPASCRFGLEVVARRELVTEGAPWMYGERSTLTARFVAFEGTSDSQDGRVFALESGKALATSGLPLPRVMIDGELGPILISLDFDAADRRHVELAALDASGARRWSLELPGEGDGHRIARGGGRVLAAWSAERSSLTESLAYVIVDERTGATLASAIATDHYLNSNEEGPAVAFVDGRFLLAWVSGVAGSLRRGPVRVATISGTTLSAPIDLPIVSDAPPDLTNAGGRAGLVTSRRGRIEWTLLDRDGRMVTGPIEVSAGIGGTDNRLPRIAWDGRLFAVAWESYPDMGAYTAVVDAGGRVSSALRLDPGDGGTVGIATGPSGFVASYTIARRRGVAATLRCRTRAAPGPRQSIPPLRPATGPMATAR